MKGKLPKIIVRFIINDSFDKSLQKTDAADGSSGRSSVIAASTDFKIGRTEDE
jgi:hypothetical protein